jgi:c-di-AMP phosphodiesterase-like protein
MASQQQQQQVLQTIPLKVIVDKQNNKVVFVEANKDFVETLFSFLSLPLATIFRLLATAATTTNNNNNDQQQQLPESSPFLANIKNLCQTVYNRNSNILWNNPFCQHMLLNPRNPCESMCMKLFLNIDDTQPSTKFYVCGFCDKFTTLRYLRFSSSKCTCGKPPEILARWS